MGIRAFVMKPIVMREMANTIREVLDPALSKKKTLYIKGKKTQNYAAIQSNFTGRFLDGYTVGEKDYRKGKLNDLLRQEEDEKKPIDPRKIRVQVFQRLREVLGRKVGIRDLAEVFKVSGT